MAHQRGRGEWARFCGTALVLALVLVAGSVPATEFRGDQIGTVVAVLDGDTLIVELDGRQGRVRICGIDAPERGRAGRRPEFLAAAATAFTQRAVLDRSVRLEREDGVPDRDRYGRLLRHVITPTGESLAEQLLAAGLARVYRNTESSRRSRFEAIEEQARGRRLGIFGPRGRSSREPPSDDRR